MSIIVTAEEELIVGRETVIDGPAPEGPFAAVFEDDGDTGYFYALDMQAEENRIQDALWIYNVAGVTDRDKPSIVKIGWSVDSQRAVLLINGYPHAVFDFAAKEGFCRAGFPAPAPDGAWSSAGHEWDDSVIDRFS